MNFNFLDGFQKNEYFWGYDEIEYLFCVFVGGGRSSQNWTIFFFFFFFFGGGRGHFYTFLFSLGQCTELEYFRGAKF